MLEKLTAIKTTEAEQLTAQALEAADMLDGCMDLKAHVRLHACPSTLLCRF